MAADGLCCSLIETLEARTLLSASINHLFATPSFSMLPQVTNATPTGYSPLQMRHAYGFDQISINGVPGDGRGQTIAIVTAYFDPNIFTDLAAFDSQYSLPALDGANGDGTFTAFAQNYPYISSDAGWALETSLDVEWAHAIAPKANILLVMANTASISNLLAAVNFARNYSGVSVVSMSWGTSEFFFESFYDSYFTTPSGHQGITFVAAAGDQGTPGIWPAFSPNVLAVGGTTLKLDSTGNILSETVWSGSGSGKSAYESRPSYQKNILISGTTRMSPDVSYDADPATGVSVYDSFGYSGQSGWFTLGGTSIGAPQWAALVAIADQGRAAKGLASFNGRNDLLPKLYAIGSNTADPTPDYHDILTGSTTGSPSSSAGLGFDLATGWGTPFADRLISDLLA